jgi:hypothetical protein
VGKETERNKWGRQKINNREQEKEEMTEKTASADNRHSE